VKIKFLVADEFRAEAAGKQMALGLYADDIIILEPKSEVANGGLPAGIDRLAFLINVSDVPEVKHIYKMQIIDPSGSPHGNEIPLGEYIIAKGTSRSFVIEAKPFLIQGVGTYKLNFFIDDIIHTFSFNFVERESMKSTMS
jgi:hypothetical protein